MNQILYKCPLQNNNSNDFIIKKRAKIILYISIILIIISILVYFSIKYTLFRKQNITYPILSTTSEELLKISPCRFYGPMPNEPRKFMYCWS